MWLPLICKHVNGRRLIKKVYIVRWEPEGCYHYSKKFSWEPEGHCYHRLCNNNNKTEFIEHIHVITHKYSLCADSTSALLVLNGTSLINDSTLLALNWRYTPQMYMHFHVYDSLHKCAADQGSAWEHPLLQRYTNRMTKVTYTDHYIISINKVSCILTIIAWLNDVCPTCICLSVWMFVSDGPINFVWVWICLSDHDDVQTDEWSR